MKGSDPMRILPNDEKKIVTIWLTNEDPSDSSFSTIPEPLLKDRKAKKYLPVVFRSGTQDLYDNTAGLLLHNRTALTR